MQQGYQMLGVWDNDILLGVAGYRFLESFIHGQFIYVDDLVVSEKTRGKGVGGRMLHYIIREASLMRFNKVVLDTALHNSLAQRFYFRQEMLATGLHFTITL